MLVVGQGRQGQALGENNGVRIEINEHHVIDRRQLVAKLSVHPHHKGRWRSCNIEQRAANKRREKAGHAPPKRIRARTVEEWE